MVFEFVQSTRGFLPLFVHAPRASLPLFLQPADVALRRNASAVLPVAQPAQARLPALTRQAVLRGLLRLDLSVASVVHALLCLVLLFATVKLMRHVWSLMVGILDVGGSGGQN